MKLFKGLVVGSVVLALLLTLGACELEVLKAVRIVQSVPVETDLAFSELEDAKAVWIREIDASRKSIEIEQMYLSHKPGEATEPVFEALERAAARGVKIRLVLSKNMSESDPAALARFRAIPGVEVRLLDLSRTTGGIQHSKFFVFDRTRAFIGSQNFDWKSLSQIHETGVMIDHKGFAEQVLRIWNIDWTLAGGGTPDLESPLKDSGLKGVELVTAPPSMNPKGMRSALTALLELINGAKKSVTVQLLNYSATDKTGPWTAISDALIDAAKRGVQVKLLMSEWNTAKPGIDDLKALHTVPGIEVKIATIPEASTGYISYARVIHSKVLVVDDEILWVGTSNWSRGYFYATRGLEVIVRDRLFAKTGSRIFYKLWDGPYSEFVDPARIYSPRRHD